MAGMSDYVKFQRDGLCGYKWNGDLQEHVAHKLEDDEVIRSLRCACEIDEGVTLLDLMRAVDSLPTLTEFLREYSWCWQIEQFHSQVSEPMRTENEHAASIEYLEVYKHAYIHEFNGETTIDLSCDFHGVGKPESCEARPRGREFYSVSMTPLYDIADLPVRLNKQLVIYQAWKPGDPPAEKVLLAGDSCFSLLDVLDAIYDDISFYGGPAEAREMLEELRDTVEQIKSGELQTILKMSCATWKASRH